MSLRLITGRANVGKSDLLRAELYSHASLRLPAVLLVPSGPDVSRAIEDVSAHTPLGVSVKTLDGLLDELWRRYGDGRVIATPVQRLAVLEESVNQRDVTGLPRSRGVLAMLAVAVQRVAESARPLEAQRLTAGPARDIGLACAAYSRLLAAASLVERAEAHRLIAERASALELPQLIALDGFTGLTAAQEMFVANAASCTRLVVTLTYDPDLPASRSAEGVVRRLEMAGERMHLDGRVPTSEMERLAAEYSVASPCAIGASGEVRLSHAWGGAAESARIAREVQDALAEGYRPSEIVVAFRDAGRRIREVASAFSEAGIEATYDARVPFAGTPFGRTVLAVLQLETLSHNQLMDVLRSPYSPAPAALIDEYDALARRSRRSDLSAAERWFGRTNEATASFLRRAKRAARTSEEADRRWYSVATEMIACANAGDTVLGDAGAARVFMEAVESLQDLGAGALRAQTLAEVLLGATVALSEDDRDGAVRVMSAERARGARCRCLILGGLSAGEFPRASRDDALSSPAIRASFAAQGIDFGERAGHDDERLLFYQVITRPTDRLVLSRQTHGDDGQMLRGSIFLEEAMDLYRDPVSRQYYEGEPPLTSLGLDGVATDPAAPVSARRELRQAALVAGEGEARVREARRRAARVAPGVSGEVARVMRGRATVSASEIEAYLQCPYRWSVERLVRPRELDERIDQAAAGLLGHDIMRSFYEAFPAETGQPRVTAETLDAARRVHAEVAAECVARVGPRTALEEMDCRTVVRRTLRIVEEDAALLPGFAPLVHEWSFGIADGDAPEDFGGFALAGRIDRVDSDGERLVLFDYKSSAIAAEHGHVKLESEGLVQLPLYAAVAMRRLGKPVAAAVYRSFRGGKPRGFVRDELASGAFVSTDVVPSQTAEECMRRAAEMAAEAVGGMRAGEIPARPRSGNCPSYCSARPFCAEWRPGRG